MKKQIKKWQKKFEQEFEGELWLSDLKHSKVEGETSDMIAIKDFLSQAIQESVVEELKALKLKARSIGSPDGYVNIEKLFDNKYDYKNMKEMLDKLTK